MRQFDDMFEIFNVKVFEFKFVTETLLERSVKLSHITHESTHSTHKLIVSTITAVSWSLNDTDSDMEMGEKGRQWRYE